MNLWTVYIQKVLLVCVWTNVKHGQNEQTGPASAWGFNSDFFPTFGTGL